MPRGVRKAAQPQRKKSVHANPFVPINSGIGTSNPFGMPINKAKSKARVVPPPKLGNPFGTTNDKINKPPLYTRSNASLIRDQGAFFDIRNIQTQHRNGRQGYQLPYYQIPHRNFLNEPIFPGNEIRNNLREYRQMITNSTSPIRRLIDQEQIQKQKEEKEKWIYPADVPPRYQNSDYVPHEYIAKFGTFQYGYDPNMRRHYLSAFVAFGPSATSHEFPRLDQVRSQYHVPYYVSEPPNYPNPEVFIRETAQDNAYPQTIGLRRFNGFIVYPLTERTTLITRDGVLRGINANGENQLWIPFSNSLDNLYDLRSTPMVR